MLVISNKDLRGDLEENAHLRAKLGGFKHTISPYVVYSERSVSIRTRNLRFRNNFAKEP